MKPKLYPPGFWEIWPLLMVVGIIGINVSKFWWLQGITVIAITYTLSLKICRLASPSPAPTSETETHGEPDSSSSSKP